VCKWLLFFFPPLECGNISKYKNLPLAYQPGVFLLREIPHNTHRNKKRIIYKMAKTSSDFARVVLRQITRYNFACMKSNHSKGYHGRKTEI
jgi:hypothetical protein